MESAEETLRRAKERIKGKSKGRVTINGKEFVIDGDDITIKNTIIDPGIRKLRAIRNLAVIFIIMMMFLFVFSTFMSFMKDQKYKQKPIDSNPAPIEKTLPATEKGGSIEKKL